MKNRHQSPGVTTFPGKCPKCGGYVTADNTYAHATRFDGWRCVSCGLTGESGGFVDIKNKTTVPLKVTR